MRGVCGRFFDCWGYEEQKAPSSPAMTRHGGSRAEGGMRMLTTRPHCRLTFLVVAVTVLAGALAQADIVTDWSSTAGEIASAGKLPPGGAYRVTAVVQTAVYEAVNAITKRYPRERVKLAAAPGASVEAAVAAANRATLTALGPVQQAARDGAQLDHDRGVHAGSGKRPHLRRRALPQLHGSGYRHGKTGGGVGSREIPAGAARQPKPNTRVTTCKVRDACTAQRHET